MYNIVSDNIAELYLEVLTGLMDKGTITKPRGFTCKELSPITMTLRKPWQNILTNQTRKINVGFALGEFLWMWDGNNDVETIARFNSKIAEFSDDGKTFFGAYGPKLIDQIDYIQKMLTVDPWTRQAVMTFWRENPPKTRDVPCTVMLHFIRRPLDYLELMVYMRSNDVWLGLPYDIHNFTTIQIALAELLGLKVGRYTHIDGSLHAYEKDFNTIHECIGSLAEDQYNETSLNFVVAQKRAMAEEYLGRKGG